MSSEVKYNIYGFWKSRWVRFCCLEYVNGFSAAILQVIPVLSSVFQPEHYSHSLCNITAICKYYLWQIYNNNNKNNLDEGHIPHIVKESVWITLTEIIGL